MFGVAAVIAGAIAFILYATGDGHEVPWTWQGFALLALTLLAAHCTWPWWPNWRRPA